MSKNRKATPQDMPNAAAVAAAALGTEPKPATVVEPVRGITAPAPKKGLAALDFALPTASTSPTGKPAPTEDEPMLIGGGTAAAWWSGDFLMVAIKADPLRLRAARAAGPATLKTGAKAGQKASMIYLSRVSTFGEAIPSPHGEPISIGGLWAGIKA